MKKLLIICTAAAMMLVPSITEAGGRNNWIGPAIFGTVLGVIIASNIHDNKTVIVQERRGHRYHRRHHHPRYRWVKVCDRIVSDLHQDRYGDYYPVMRNECWMVKKSRW